MRLIVRHTIRWKRQQIANELQILKNIAFILQKDCDGNAATDRKEQPKTPGKINQPPHTGTLRRQEAAGQRSDIPIQVERRQFLSLVTPQRKSPSPRLPAITSCPGAFVAASKVYFLSKCKQTIPKNLN